MRLYASATLTKRNRAELRAHGWRMLYVPQYARRYRPDGAYALDNGAWSCYSQGLPFDFVLYEKLLKKYGKGADWAIAPDAVGAGLCSLSLSVAWLPRVLELCPVALIAVQDGVTVQDVAPYLSSRVGVAIGGTTGWKLEQLATKEWGQACRRVGATLHCLRVNSQKRIRMAAHAGCHSIDGSGVSRFSKTVRPLTLAAQKIAKELEHEWA